VDPGDRGDPSTVDVAVLVVVQQQRQPGGDIPEELLGRGTLGARLPQPVAVDVVAIALVPSTYPVRAPASL
jgi:hypothetical protein